MRASEGTYFVCADARPVGFDDGIELCHALPERAGVVAVPVQVFVDDPGPWRHLVRFACCKRDDVLDDAIDRLAESAPLRRRTSGHVTSGWPDSKWSRPSEHEGSGRE